MNHKLDQAHVTKRVKLERFSTTPDSQIEWNKIVSVQMKIDRMSDEALRLFLSDPICPSNERLQAALQKAKPIKFSRATLHSMHKNEDVKNTTEQVKTFSKLDECEECHTLIDEVLQRWLKEAKKVVEKQQNKLVTQSSTISRGDASKTIDVSATTIADDPNINTSTQDDELEPNVDREEPLPVGMPVITKDTTTQTINEVEPEDICTTTAIGTKRKHDGEKEKTGGSNEVQQRPKEHNDNEACPTCLKTIASLEIQNAVLRLRASQADNVITRDRHEEDVNKIYKEFGQLNGMVKGMEAGNARQIQELQQFNALLRGQNEELKKQNAICNGEILRIKQAVHASLRRDNGRTESPSHNSTLGHAHNSTQLQVGQIPQRRSSESVGESERVMQTNQTLGIMSNAQLHSSQQATTSFLVPPSPQNQEVSVQMVYPTAGHFQPVFTSQHLLKEQQPTIQAGNYHQFLAAQSNHQQIQHQQHQQQKLQEKVNLQPRAQTQNEVSVVYPQAQKQACLLPMAANQRTIYQNSAPVSITQRSVSESLYEKRLQKEGESQEAKSGAEKECQTKVNGSTQIDNNQK